MHCAFAQRVFSMLDMDEPSDLIDSINGHKQTLTTEVTAH